MRNINNDNRKTIFLDIDGTLVPHNYDPENIPDVLLKRTVEYLKNNLDCALVLVTSRNRSHMWQVKKLLEDQGIRVWETITGLPTGQRILINDFRSSESSPTAVAINVPSEEGVSNDANCGFYTQRCG